MRVFTLLKKAFTKLGLIADYVVEVGASGDWTWKKWNSGEIDLHCRKKYAENTIQVKRSYGAIYSTQSQLVIELPFNILLEDGTTVHVSPKASGMDYAGNVVLTASNVKFYWCNPVAYPSGIVGTVEAYIHVHAYWKTPTWGGVIHNLLFQRRWIPCGYSPC